MRRFTFGILIFSLALSTVIFAHAQSETGQPRNIILIGWDGVGRDYLKGSIAKAELPNLIALTSEGAIVAIDILRFTDTKAGWAQILTGYEPETTGIFTNFIYGPIPKGYTVFERLKSFFGSGFVTAALIGKYTNMEADAPQRVVVPHRGKVQVPAQMFYYTKNTMDVFVNGLESNETVGAEALKFLQNYTEKPFFIFLHFAQPDSRGHQYGARSKEYNAGLRSCDKWLGKIMQELKVLGLYDKTLIYVTSDHGFDDKNHIDAPYVFLATNDPKVMRRGRRQDITPTILARFGVDLNKLQPPLDGHPLTEPYEAPKW